MRSFTNSGKWSKLLSQLAPGDIILIEIGHNDDRDPTNPLNWKPDHNTLPRTDNKTVTVNAKGESEVVHTFGCYLTNMIANA
jgi:rhamnogalacturonan acetylesterase